MSLSDVTVGIKAFIRIDCLERTFEALIDKGFHEVIVADDAPEDTSKELIYEKYKKHLPLRILKLPYDTGLAEGRNEIVRECSTELLLMLDDDQGIRQDIWKLKQIIELEDKIGGVSCIWDEYGAVRCTATNLRKSNRVMIKELIEEPEHLGPVDNQYQFFDFIPNSTLFRTKCLEEFPWDKFYKIGGEHVDFYWNHKLNSDWKFAVARNVTIDHFPEIKNTSYRKFRHGDRIKKSMDYFHSKHDLRGSMYISQLIGKPDKFVVFLRKLGFNSYFCFKLLQMRMKLKKLI